jgi:ubiquitin-protein ligase
MQEKFISILKIINNINFIMSRLRFRFPSEYPIESPEVVFIDGSPDHEHIYSNGFICMSILYDGNN